MLFSLVKKTNNYYNILLIGGEKFFIFFHKISWSNIVSYFTNRFFCYFLSPLKKLWLRDRPWNINKAILLQKRKAGSKGVLPAFDASKERRKNVKDSYPADCSLGKNWRIWRNILTASMLINFRLRMSYNMYNTVTIFCVS